MPATDLTGFPAQFADIEALDDYMSRPSAALVADLQAVEGDILVIGVGGKMGPTVARLAKRAAPDKRVIGVARFSDPGLAARLEGHGIETIAADLLDREAVAALPRAANVIFMAGRKFGSTGREDLTWAMNAHVPAMVAETFRDSRIIAYSTICVYSFVPVLQGGAAEDAALDPPGEYANSCIARERMFEYFSNLHGTPGMLIRLSYAIDMRYGVLYDIARKVWTGAEIDVTMGHVNVIWQGDAASQSLRALRHATAPTTPINVSGPETASVRALAGAFAERFDRPARIVGEEAPTAWVSDTGKAARLFGYPSVPLAQMIEWTADWVAREQPSFGKDTHFEVRSGTY